MVMTRTANGGSATGLGPLPPARRQVARPAGVPGGRAVLGGVLVALAGVGTFLAWSRAAAPPHDSYAVAGRELRPDRTARAPRRPAPWRSLGRSAFGGPN